MNEDDVLTSGELNDGLERLSDEERETIAPIIGSVDNQPEFRKQIREIGRRRVQHLLDKMFPDRSVAVQDLRRSLTCRLAQEEGRDVAKYLMWGEKTVEVGENDDND